MSTAYEAASATHAPEVVLGVGAGIAAYKSCELLRLLTESGYGVRVVPTPDALRFVGEATWAALSGRPAAQEVWDTVHQVEHVRVGQNADLIVVAPATADLLARAAHGRADDLLTNTLLTARCPVLFAPAMHTEMWEHPATQANVATLRERGAVVLDPASGRLTGTDTGRGRLPEPEEIHAVSQRLLNRGNLPADLRGCRVLITAGGTREPIDPVRYLGNHSSGRQGYAFAETALARGAEVTVVSANVTLPDPAGATVRRVGSAAELREAVLQERSGADVIVMAAAVADFRPVNSAEGKLKKDGAQPQPVALAQNPDILAEISQDRTHSSQVVVGFAAETEDVLGNGRSKLAAKGCDLLVVNRVGEGRAFGTTDNQVAVLSADGSVADIPLSEKADIADRVWDSVVERVTNDAS
ncbi:phosphopantothenate-cysteine ligase /phosphopantothenoylcysteine decarboxylase [Haloactinospora alba]|uniref:Coenzyme A biosynthesis bifunctional protein CoaBC n=1 Tax=Haloactinospora alba TaxID=405555 RepID=A0A543NHQ0_9ACTN|nr:bifunctional phosphopantothenoylcysteine decarboxylase/phosphopantothenate--cysteine ligase CoaBC [Haloactinospora alba]TQN31353.1 phosphopantothenate-cysteine ligase /phosphopantothenoylcysteine decarboxylase [Haloactinospora alba]